MIKLLDLRKKRKQTQQEVADYLGVTRQCYNRYENEARECDYQALITLADYFNVSVDYLLGREGNDESTPILSAEEKELISLITSLTDEETDELTNFVNYIISKRK